MLSNQEHLVALKKAVWGHSDLVSDGGAMNQGYAKEFVQLTTKKSVALPDMNVFGTTHQSYKMPNLKFASNILQPGTSGQALPEARRTEPTIGKVEIDTQLFKGSVPIPDEIFEDNVEEARLKSTIQGLMSDALKGDVEWIVFEGDTASSTPALAVMDGLFKLATTNTKDAGGARLSLTILKSAFKMIPSEFRDQKKNMRVWVGSNGEEDYGDAMMDRATQYGDDSIKGDTSDHPHFKKMPVIGVPKIAEDLGGGSNNTHALMCHPKNATVGIWKNIQMEMSRDADAGLTNIHVRMRFQPQWAEEAGVVEIINLLATA
jgi:hypothetical protein